MMICILLQLTQNKSQLAQASQRCFLLLGTLVAVFFLAIRPVASQADNIPTIAPTDPQLAQRVQDALHLCSLPCWWGFYVGEAKLEDWLRFLKNNGFDQTFLPEYTPEVSEDGAASGHLWMDFDSDLSDSNLSLGFVATQHQLEYLGITLSRPFNWLDESGEMISLPSVVNNLDRPISIYVYTDGINYPFLSDLTFLIVDTQETMLFKYTFEISKSQPKPIDWQALQLCLGIQQTTWMEIILTASNEESPDIRHRLTGIDPKDDEPGYRPLNEVFDINTATFVQFFEDQPDKCLEVAYLNAP